MKKFIVFRFILSVLILLTFSNCNKEESSSAFLPIYGLEAKGTIPSQLNNEMYLGLFENPDYTWMANSGIPWNSRYMYLVPGWMDNWGTEEPIGNIARKFLNECEELGALPFFQFYILNDIVIDDAEDLYAKTADTSIMKQYYDQYILMLNIIKEYGKPVVVLLEADGFAVLQQQTNSNPEAYTAVADCGVPELTDLPKTMAGWGMAFLELKKDLEVDNMMLGIHISHWATREDIAYSSSQLALEPVVDEVYDFLAPMGLVPNQTGLEFDFIVCDPSDRDADYFRLQRGEDKWWDMSSEASINSASYNRYAEWMRIWNVKSEKRWIVWQIPLGNKWHKNVSNGDVNPQEGYKDNRVEYFLGNNSSENIALWTNSGAVALLFGRGAHDQANFTNDQDDKGDLYMKKLATRFYEKGGMEVKR
jgi:hypothetical protein